MLKQLITATIALTILAISFPVQAKPYKRDSNVYLYPNLYGYVDIGDYVLIDALYLNRRRNRNYSLGYIYNNPNELHLTDGLTVDINAADKVSDLDKGTQHYLY